MPVPPPRSAILPWQQLAAAFTHDASTYDEVWSPAILPAAESLVSAIGLEDVRRVLDVGAGAGALTAAIRAAAPHAAIGGVDTAEGMLKIARDRRGLPGAVADAAVLPVPTTSVDAIILAYVLFLMPDPDAALTEAARVLRPGGRAGTITWAEEHPMRGSALWDEALDAAGAPKPTERGDHRGLDSPAAMQERLRHAGLVRRDAWTEPVDYTFTPAGFWRLRVEFGNPRWRLERLAPPARETLLARLRALVADLGPDDLRFRGRVVLAVAERRG